MPNLNEMNTLNEINHTIYNNLNAVPNPDDPYHAEFDGMLCQVCWENQPSTSNEDEGVRIYYCQECDEDGWEYSNDSDDEDNVNGVGMILLQATLHGGNNALQALQDWYVSVYGDDEIVLN